MQLSLAKTEFTRKPICAEVFCWVYYKITACQNSMTVMQIGCIRQAKSNFTLFICIPFPDICEWYMNSVWFLLKSGRLRILQSSVKVFVVISTLKHARGQNILFQNASLFICFCSFATGQFQTLETQSVRHAIELLFKVQISPNHPTCNTFK